jgi:hypothetical protein
VKKRFGPAHCEVPTRSPQTRGRPRNGSISPRWCSRLRSSSDRCLRKVARTGFTLRTISIWQNGTSMPDCKSRRSRLWSQGCPSRSRCAADGSQPRIREPAPRSINPRDALLTQIECISIRDAFRIHGVLIDDLENWRLVKRGLFCSILYPVYCGNVATRLRAGYILGLSLRSRKFASPR